MYPQVLVLVLLTVGIAPVVWEVRHHSFDLFNLKNPFVAYYLIQLGVSGLITLRTGQASVIGLDPGEFSAAYVQALWLAILGLLAFYAGYYFQRSVTLRLPRVFRAAWKPRRYQRVAAAYFIIGAAAFLLFLRSNGGLVAFLANREAFRSGGLEGQGVLTFPAGTLPVFGALVYFLGTTFDEGRQRSALPALMLMALALVPAFLMGFRSGIGLPVIQFAVLWNYARRRLSSGRILVVMVPLLIGFTVYGIQRAVPPGTSPRDTVELAREAVANDPGLAYAVIERSRGLEVVAAEVEKLRRTHDFDLGYRSALEAATILVPRALWKDKPEPTSVRFTTYFFGNAFAWSRGEIQEQWGGIPPTVIGELYWHFGLAGVILGMYFLGGVAKIAFVTRRLNAGDCSVQLAYAVFFTSFAMFAETIQGYLNGLVMYAVVLVGTAAVLSAVLARRAPQRGPAVMHGPLGGTV